MGEIVLVRHGQANAAATNEEDYDRLSDLGREQARWLGAWMAEHERPFDRVLAGSLNRQSHTAAEMGHDEVETDTRLNEMDYYALAHELLNRFGVPLPSLTDFPSHMPRTLEAWEADEIRGCETFAEFELRVAALIAEAARPGVRILCVTSGGVIGMCLRKLLGLSPRRMAEVILPVMNTSVHRLNVRPHGTYLGGFNAVPHLEGMDRAHAKTFV